MLIELGLRDSIQSRPKKKNIEPEQHEALKELPANINMVIKQAGKDSATIIQNRADNVAEGTRQLSDHCFYQPLDEGLTIEHNRKRAADLDNMHKRALGEITARVDR